MIRWRVTTPDGHVVVDAESMFLAHGVLEFRDETGCFRAFGVMGWLEVLEVGNLNVTVEDVPDTEGP